MMNSAGVDEYISIFFFFSDHRTLKFQQMQCNPTNKKIVALFTLTNFHSGEAGITYFDFKANFLVYHI